MNIKCEKCGRLTPRHLIDEVMIYSREFVGKAWICDECYVDVEGNQIRNRREDMAVRERFFEEHGYNCSCRPGYVVCGPCTRFYSFLGPWRMRWFKRCRRLMCMRCRHCRFGCLNLCWKTRRESPLKGPCLEFDERIPWWIRFLSGLLFT